MTIHGLWVRAAAVVLVMSGLAMASCGKSEQGSVSGPSPLQGSVAGPSPLSSSAGPGGARSMAYPSGGGLGRSVINFPPRNEPNAFFRDLVAYYRDRLLREQSPTYVDPEGQNVWLTEYFRFYLNGCSHQEAISRTLSEITSGGSRPVCGAETPNFPPRNLPFEFQGQLEATYRDVLARISDLVVVPYR